MKPAGPWVYCEDGDEVHVDLPDPYGIGPHHFYDDEVDTYYIESPNWTRVEMPPGYTEKTLWFYACPGPHRQVWVGRRLKETRA